MNHLLIQYLLGIEVIQWENIIIPPRKVITSDFAGYGFQFLF